uniref:Uncharacterized protein n=1 Tax=Oryza barthii TaxID=65489 RepID=A0A0D3GS57_9ORYZ
MAVIDYRNSDSSEHSLSSLWNLLGALHKIVCVDFALTYLSLIKEANHIILGSWSYSQALALIFYGSNFVLNRARAYCRKESAHACPNHCTPSQEKQVDQKFSQNMSKKIHIHCEPNYTCHQPPNLRDQEISLDPLEELAINSFGTSMIRSYQ